MPADLARIEELIGRLEAARGPDREIDTSVWLAMGAKRSVMGDLRLDHWLPMDYRITASVDAALALLERVLPGWMITNLCEWDDEKLRALGPWMAQVRPRGEVQVPPPGSCMHAPTPALALVLSLLKALKERQDG